MYAALLMFLKNYMATATVILAGDALWLFWLMKPFYVRHIGHLFAPNPNLIPAIFFYLLYPVSIVLLTPKEGASWQEIALRGALLGATAYGTYNLTNHATLLRWPLIVTLADIVWGTTITGLAAGALATTIMSTLPK